MLTIELTQAERKILRQIAGLRQYDHLPVVVVDGGAAPEQMGSAWRYETLGGRPILHPSAYAAKGWSNMRYIPSDRRVEVGSDWIEQWRSGR
jgi:hypothetical protein